MKKENGSKNEERRELTWILYLGFALIIFALVSSLIMLLVESNFFRTDKRYDLAKIGSWGDTIGGLLNPALSFLALIGLLWTIKIQSKELEYTRKEIENSTAELKGSRKANESLVRATEQSNIESAFFNLFEVFREAVEFTVTKRIFTDGNVTERGKRAFELVYNHFDARASFIYADWNNGLNRALDDYENWHPIIDKIYGADTSQSDRLLFIAQRAYSLAYKDNQADLGSYFRILFNLLRFLDEKEELLPKTLFESYFKIVRACLSDYELLVIFLNCLSEDGEPMKKYVDQFELFDNLPTDLLLVNIEDNHGNTVETIDFRNLLENFSEKSFGGIHPLKDMQL